MTSSSVEQLTREDILRAASGFQPSRRLQKWIVIVEGRALPARPLVLTAAGVAPNDPTNSHMAVAKLKALGFETRYDENGAMGAKDQNDLWLASNAERTVWVKARYFDASALVKLVLNEPHSEAVRAFARANTNLYTNSLCFGEAFGVLKTKWMKRRLTIDAYYAGVRTLTRDVRNKIQFDELDWLVPSTQHEIDRLGRKHHLDLSDALQLVTILKGRFSHMGPNSKSVLITADNALAKAAAKEGIRLWNCNGPRPSDV